MRQKISAGALVFREGKILLVHHKLAGSFDFWVPPGGGVKHGESVFDGSRRETYEETGLVVEPLHICYLEEFLEEQKHVIKTWVYAEVIEGTLTLENLEQNENFVVDVGFFDQNEIQKMNVFPEILKTASWERIHNQRDGCELLKNIQPTEEN